MVANYTTKPGCYIAAVCGDWSTGEKITFVSSEVKSNAVDLAAAKRAWEDATRKSNLEKEKQNKIAQSQSVKIFGDADPKGTHPYIAEKRLSGLHGARVFFGHDETCLVIPLRDSNGTLWGLQRIYNKGEKRFIKGMRKESCFHTIPDNADLLKENLIILCEGFATGASIYEATGRTVVCAMDAGNLSKVGKAIFKDNPDAAFLIAADDDRYTDGNPGLTKGDEARITTGGYIVSPQFREAQDWTTDFNDLARLEGNERVKEQIEAAIKKVRRNYVRCLGFRGQSYYFSSSENKYIIELGELGQNKLLSLMPLEYWQARYPNEKKGVDWTRAGSDLMKQCRDMGTYRPGSSRERGIWLDSGKTVVHLGDRLLVDNNEIDLHDFKGKFHYTMDEAIERIHPFPMTVQELEPFRNAVNILRLRDPWSKYFLMGWPVQALLSGYIPWRTHLHLTSQAGAGKSTIQNDILFPMVSVLAHPFGAGATTEAGIRSHIGSRAMVAIVDEFESEAKHSGNRLESILDYMRQCSTGGFITKGSAAQKSVEYLATSSFVLSSVGEVIFKPTDASRFIQIHLEKKDKDPDQWETLVSYTNQIKEPGYAEKFFARCIDVLALKLSQRNADLYSSVLAGWNLVTSDEVVTQEVAQNIVAQINTEKEVSTSQPDDHRELLDWILGLRIEINWTNSGVGQKMSMGDAMHKVLIEGVESDHNIIIRQYGIRLVKQLTGEVGFFFATGAAEFKRLVKDHPKGNSCKSILLRSDGAKESRQRMGIGNIKGVFIPTESVKGVDPVPLFPVPSLVKRDIEGLFGEE
jgi:putative DNA primase/helicase